MAKALLISRNDLINKTLIGGNVDADKFLQFVEIAQETHIQNYLGTDLYNKITGDITTSSLTGDYQTLVTNYVKPMLIHYATSEYLNFGAYTIGNGGIFKHSSENSETATAGEISMLADKALQYAKSYTDRFLAHMQYEASTKYPEYYTNSNDDVSPTKDENFTNWLL